MWCSGVPDTRRCEKRHAYSRLWSKGSARNAAPLTATLPTTWPHSLFKWPYAERAKALARTYPDAPSVAQVAHAELFTQLRPEEFAACPYHQADGWEAIAQAVLAHAEAE
ncbi:hypothetical protein GCM10020000_84560 [Streptomyces olivoverticillatus]